MRILVLTQKVDVNDPVLGFFHNWTNALARRFRSVVVVCLYLGSQSLPDNVRVLSLGKEKKISRLNYVWRFYWYIWRERKNYDSVFVHMNQEYVLLGGLMWCLMGKKVFMWRNHHAGNFFTDVAAFFCTKVFCTSRFSYTAKYQKTALMPVGIDADLFIPSKLTMRKPRSVLFLSRMDPTKKAHILVDVAEKLIADGVDFSLSFFGDPSPASVDYYNRLIDRVINDNVLASRINFYAGVPNHHTPDLYRTHEVFVNLSSSGMYDKTIFEAAACGSLILSCNKNLNGEIDQRLIFVEDSVADLSIKIKNLIQLPEKDKLSLGHVLREYVLEKHSLVSLSDRLLEEMR